MSLRWLRSVRVTSCSGNYLFGDQFIGLVQKLERAPLATANHAVLLPLRSISSSVIHRNSVHGTGSDGPWEPPEESSGQDRNTSQDAGDKRMWRKWIEERLAQSGTAEEAENSFSRGSVANKTVNRPSIPGKQSSPILAKSSFFNENGKSLSIPDEDGTVGKSSTSLDAIFRAALKPSTREATTNAEDSRISNFKNPFRQENAKSSFFPDRGSTKNSSSASNRGSIFQESTKQPSKFPVRQIPGKAPRVQLDVPPVEALDDFEDRVLGSVNDMDGPIDDDFLRDLDDIGKSARGIRDNDDDELVPDEDEDEDWGDKMAHGLTDLALSNSQEFDLEDEKRPYRMRSDRLFFPGQTYDPEDLDLSKEADAEKPTVRTRKRYPSKEVFKIADFRNPRYLSKFIRESSRILPKRHFQLSAKAQRKVAREIKTARILGLMPFTSMGDPPFRFLRSRSEEDGKSTKSETQI